MEKTKVDLISSEEDLNKVIEFAITTLSEREKVNYKKNEFPKILEEIKKLDVFDEKFLFGGVSRGEMVVFRVTKGKDIKMVAALNRTNSRLLFFITNGEEITTKMAEKLLSNLSVLCDTSEPFTIMAFYTEARFFEQLGFVRIRPFVTFNSIIFVPMKQSVEQYDNENY